MSQPSTLAARPYGCRPMKGFEFACTTFGGVKIVIATDDLESARAALQWAQAMPRDGLAVGCAHARRTDYRPSPNWPAAVS